MQRVVIALGMALACRGQQLSANWAELPGPDFVRAIQQAKGVCLLPFGIIEKHGPTGPMGTDLLNVRYAKFEAVKQEYAIVFPEYYFRQIFEAKHSRGRSPTAPICSLRCSRKQPRKWLATDARRSSLSLVTAATRI